MWPPHYSTDQHATCRVAAGGDVINSAVPGTSWAGQLLVPQIWHVPLQMNSFHQDMVGETFHIYTTA